MTEADEKKLNLDLEDDDRKNFYGLIKKKSTEESAAIKDSPGELREMQVTRGITAVFSTKEESNDIVEKKEKLVKVETDVIFQKSMMEEREAEYLKKLKEIQSLSAFGLEQERSNSKEETREPLDLNDNNGISADEERIKESIQRLKPIFEHQPTKSPIMEPADIGAKTFGLKSSTLPDLGEIKSTHISEVAKISSISEPLPSSRPGSKIR